MKKNYYHDKVVVITGASSGIGKSMALEFARRGSSVVLGARTEKRLLEVVDEIKSFGGEAIHCVMDVTQENLCKSLVDTAISVFGRIDIFICNAGISMRANFNEVELDVLHRLMNVNFWGTVNCTKYALPYLIQTKGALVGVSSVAGIHGLPGRTGYSASKFAMTGFLETIRIENMKNNVHVMIAIPGFTSSNIRYTALTANGSPQGESPRNEKRMMSSEVAAKYIAEGLIKNKQYLMLDFEGKATSFLKKFNTSLLDRLFYVSMSKEPNAPVN